jgi:hypothetical protein
MLYATPVHAVRDVHHVSDYHTIAEESVRFDPIGRLPSYHVARLTTKRILQQNSRVTPLLATATDLVLQPNLEPNRCWQGQRLLLSAAVA